MAKAPRGSDQFVIRLPDGMRARIAEQADGAGRSMNAEIIYRLETYNNLEAEIVRLKEYIIHQSEIIEMVKKYSEIQEQAQAAREVAEFLSDRMIEVLVKMIEDKVIYDKPGHAVVETVKKTILGLKKPLSKAGQALWDERRQSDKEKGLPDLPFSSPPREDLS